MRITFLAILALASCPSFGNESMQDCAAIESAVSRLDCYDRVARNKQPGARTPDAPKPVSAEQHAPGPAVPSVMTRPAPEAIDPALIQNDSMQEDGPAEPVSKKAAEPPKDEDFGITLFGKRIVHDDSSSIQSRIESIYKSEGGMYVMTLANGQVWMEREPGRRRIDPDQDVTIVKLRWHYSMTLEGQERRVTVQRID